ncbi:MAG: DUF4140 domain-containing protein, partial [Bacteroidota bacterium]
MKRKDLLILLWVYPIYLFGQAQERTLASQISQVTVFLNSAQIQRTTTYSLPMGESILTFSKLSPYIDKNSIQVQGEGAFTLVSVSHELNYLDSLERRQELVDLQSRQKGLKKDSVRIESLRKVYQREEQMLLKNQVLAGSQTGLDLQTLAEAIDYQRKQMREVLLQQDTYTEELDAIQKKQTQLRKQLNSLREEKEEPTGEITIKVRTKTSTQATFSLSYVVANAGWFSRYNVRVDDISQPLRLEHKAQVFQQTGEDW